MMKKRGWAVFFAALLCCVPLLALAAIPEKPMDVFYVNDYADVIGASDEQEMVALGTRLEDLTGAQVVAVAVPFLDGLDIEEYCAQLFNQWQLGQKDKNNGVLLLLSIGDRLVHTTVGKGLEASLPASVLGKFEDDYGVPHFADDDFSLGMRNNYTALCNKVASIYGVSLVPESAGGGAVDDGYTYDYDYNYVYDYGYRDVYGFSFGGISFMNIIVGIIVLMVILSIVRSIFRPMRSRGSGGFPGFLFGWFMGRGSRPYGHGHYRQHHRTPPPPPPHMGGGPRPRPPAGRSSGGLGGFGGFGGGGRSGGGFGGGGRSGGGPRSGGGGSTRGGGAGRKF